MWLLSEMQCHWREGRVCCSAVGEREECAVVAVCSSLYRS